MHGLSRAIQSVWKGYLARRDIGGDIVINVMSATGLPAPLVIKKINPYVVVELMDKHGQVITVTVQWRSLSITV